MSKDLQRQRQRLETLFEKVSDMDDLELQAEWAKYLCVRTSGLIEEAVRIVLEDYSEDRSETRVSNYVSKELEYFSNPKTGKIVSLLGSFDRTWGTLLEKEMEGDLKDAVNSIVANRHLIAHGQDVNLSFVQMRDFHQRALRAIDTVAQIVDS